MTEPQTITTEHLRALLDADDDAVLSLVGGTVEVVRPDHREDGQPSGGFDVVTRRELVEQLGDGAGDEDLERQAAALSTAVQEIGG